MRQVPHPSPGDILLHEFLLPMEVSTEQLSAQIGVAETELLEIVSGQLRITPRLAQALSEAFGTSEKFWLGLQQSYDEA